MHTPVLTFLRLVLAVLLDEVPERRRATLERSIWFQGGLVMSVKCETSRVELMMRDPAGSTSIAPG